MKALLIYHALIRRLGLLEVGAGIFLLAAVIVLVFSQVVARYLFDRPQAWVEELCAYLFIWTVFLGAGAAMKLDRHIRVSSFEDSAGAGFKLFLRLLSFSVTVTALAVVAFYARKFIAVEMRSTSIALPVNIPRAFFFSVPLIWACVSISLSALYVLGRDLVHILAGAQLPPPFSPPAGGEDY